MFYDIVHLYRLKDKTTNNLKKIIFQFCYKTLWNENIVSKGDGQSVENHHNYVKRVTDYLDNCQNILNHLIEVKNVKDKKSIKLSIAVCKLIEFYTISSLKNKGGIPSKDWTPECQEVLKNLDLEGREDILFSCLSIYNDDLKLAIVNILNATPVDQFQYKESTQLAAILKDYKNVGTGKNEEVLGTIFLILTKYVKFGEPQSVKPFIRNMRVPCIEETLDILGKNMSRDLRAEEEEQGEKDMLSIAATLFLKVLSRKPETGENKLGKVSSQMSDIIKEIIINEQDYNPRNA